MVFSLFAESAGFLVLRPWTLKVYLAENAAALMYVGSIYLFVYVVQVGVWYLDLNANS